MHADVTDVTPLDDLDAQLGPATNILPAEDTKDTDEPDA